MVVAANAFGYQGNVSYSEVDDSLTMSVDMTSPRQPPEFSAIPECQCTRAAFDGYESGICVQINFGPSLPEHLLLGAKQTCFILHQDVRF